MACKGTLKTTCRFSLIVAALLPALTGAVEVTYVSQNGDTVGRYEKYEATFILDTTFDNPFDANEVAVDALITGPTNPAPLIVPAFYYRRYQVVETAPETYINPGARFWKVRFAPRRLGDYQVDLRIRVNDAVTTVVPSVAAFACVESADHGFIRRDPNDVHCLQYEDGTPRINIGHNVCWTRAGLADFQTYFQAMHTVKENWTRIWMTHFNNGTILEWRPNSSGYFDGLGRYSLQIAQRLDAIVEAAEQAGIGIQLVLQHHGQFSTNVNPNWDENPYNQANGGMLARPEEFFSNAEARRLTRNKYRYIVARWGYSPAILAWELWNEVQFTDGWRNTHEDVVQWHQEMSDYIRRIDPQEHLITTSADTGEAFAAIWNLPSIDLIQHHQYGNPDTESYRDSLALLNDTYDKPVVMGEFGTGQGNPENDPDALPEPQRSQLLDGLVLHNGIWASFFAKSSGHLWWWDTYIHPQDLYSVFVPLQEYARDESLSGLSQAPRVVSGFQSITARPLILDFWGVSTQTEFWFDGRGFPGMDQLNTYLHGSDKAAYRSDPIFHLNMPTEGNLVVAINTISGWGNNRLRILINGAATYTQSVTNGQSNVSYTFPLAAGEQTVQIENAGQDWIQIARYEFQPARIAKTNSLGLMDDHRALLWIYDVDNQYGRTHHGLLTDETLSVPGLADGVYDVTVWDSTGQGGILEQAGVDVTHQTLEYTLPPFEGDIAVKIKPASTADSDDPE